MQKMPVKITKRYNEGDELSPWREALNDIIFGAETPMGKGFDVLLIICIMLSVTSVMLDSVVAIQQKHAELFFYIEWTFTILFTIEYFLRIICVRRPWRYCTSFFGVVDLLSIIPTYLSLVLLLSLSDQP